MVDITLSGEVVAVILLLGYAAVPLICLALIVWLIWKRPESFFKKRKSSFNSKLESGRGTKVQEFVSCPHFSIYSKSLAQGFVPDECYNCTKLIECAKHRNK